MLTRRKYAVAAIIRAYPLPRKKQEATLAKITKFDY